MVTESFYKKTPYILLIILLLGQVISAQDNKSDTTDSGGVKWFGYPFAFYTPETSLAFGAGGVLEFQADSSSNPSSLTASGFYTINNQYNITLKPQFYLQKNRYLIQAKFNFGEEFDYFNGIGPTSPDITNDQYLQGNFIIILKLLSEVFDKRFKLGAIYDFRKMNVLDKDGNAILDSNAVEGSNGGLTSGLGFIASWDTRDNIFYPSKGGYYQISATYYSQALGSDFDYNKYLLDFRRYHSIADNHILAVQTYLMAEFAYPPFYDLALLGGDKEMRGYLKGRYRDKAFYTVQAEYRVANVISRFGFVLFAGAGDVASSVEKFGIDTIKPTIGFGIRYRLDEKQKLDIRADIGFGRDTNGIYFGIDQAF